ncbi:MAG: polysaccharide deacetylase family protein [Bacteroidetes bacterium]|nr:polysaccharide deacetylase family protein [Bacteroidota bacterium]
MNLFRTPFFLPRFYPSLLWRVPTDKKELFLTFDDGPVPGPTEFVVNTLQSYQAKATFFCIGDNVRKHPTIFAKVLNGGHAVGNHTFNHLKGWSTSRQSYLENIHECEAQFQQHGISSSNLFRPPYGRITSSQIRALKPGYKIVMWDVLTSDYSRSLSPEHCLKGSIEATRPGSIIVFHDSLKAERNMTYALPRLLDYFSNQGYVFRTLREA